LEKPADVLSFIPVYRTVLLYKQVTTARSPYPGRGSVLAQMVLVGEYYGLVARSFDAALKVEQLLHAVLLNVLDEIDGIHTASETTEPPE